MKVGVESTALLLLDEGESSGSLLSPFDSTGRGGLLHWMDGVCFQAFHQVFIDTSLLIPSPGGRGTARYCFLDGHH